MSGGPFCWRCRCGWIGWGTVDAGAHFAHRVAQRLRDPRGAVGPEGVDAEPIAVGPVRLKHLPGQRVIEAPDGRPDDVPLVVGEPDPLSFMEHGFFPAADCAVEGRGFQVVDRAFSRVVPGSAEFFGQASEFVGCRPFDSRGATCAADVAMKAEVVKEGERPAAVSDGVPVSDASWAGPVYVLRLVPL